MAGKMQRHDADSLSAHVRRQLCLGDHLWTVEFMLYPGHLYSRVTYVRTGGSVDRSSRFSSRSDLEPVAFELVRDSTLALRGTVPLDES